MRINITTCRRFIKKFANHRNKPPFISVIIIQPVIRLRGGLVATLLCTSQWRRRYVPNETPNDVLVERRQGVSVVRLYDVVLEHCDDVLKGRSNDVLSARLHDVSEKSQMKHPTTSQWYVAKMPQWYVSTTPHYYVPMTSPVSPKWNT